MFDSDGDGQQDAETLFSLAGEYLTAAELLHATPPTNINYWSVTYFLFGHTAELLLKSFLCDRGTSISELKKIGHDLEKMIQQARSLGFPPELLVENLLLLAPTYRDKNFEYRTRRRKSFPDAELLLREIKKINAFVFQQIARF